MSCSYRSVAAMARACLSVVCGTNFWRISCRSSRAFAAVLSMNCWNDVMPPFHLHRVLSSSYDKIYWHGRAQQYRPAIDARQEFAAGRGCAIEHSCVSLLDRHYNQAQSALLLAGGIRGRRSTVTTVKPAKQKRSQGCGITRMGLWPRANIDEHAETATAERLAASYL